jgi:transposase
MNSVGIDLHRKRSHVAVIDADGSQLLSRRIVNDPQTFLELLEGIDGESKIALEATYGWEWLADVLEEAGYELHLAHPLRTKAIASARVKTDAVDARTLAHLLRADLLPEAYIAPRELRDLRDLLRHRVALTRMRSALKQRVGAILAKHGIQRPYSNLFGPGGMRFLDELELREGPRRRLDSLLALIGDFDREIDQTSAEIDRRAKADAFVEVLCQVRGIGRYIAMLVIAEVGDISRFPSARHLCAWAGPDADRPQLRRQGPTRPHHRPGLAGAALGLGRGRPALRPRRRPTARRLRADQQAPRQIGRQGRRRPQDPHPLLLRPARRRDPLPDATGQGAHDQNSGAHTMTRRATADAPNPEATSGRSSELVCCQWPPPAEPDGRRPRT